MDSPVVKELQGVTTALPEPEPLARLVPHSAVEPREEAVRHERAEAMVAQALGASVSEAPSAGPRLSRAGHEAARPWEALLFVHLRLRVEQQRPHYTRRIAP
jgi:hypothetical protein